MTTAYPRLTFVATFILLIGIFAAAHTLFNLTLSKYPQAGVLAINTSGNPPAMQRESDCTYSQVYFEDDGKTQRAATAAEKRQNQMDRQRCLDGLAEVRAEVKRTDISVSALFLFVGLGLLLTPRYFKK